MHELDERIGYRNFSCSNNILLFNLFCPTSGVIIELRLVLEKYIIVHTRANMRVNSNQVKRVPNKKECPTLPSSFFCMCSYLKKIKFGKFIDVLFY